MMNQAFNNSTRCIDVKLEIFFDGDSNDPFVISKENHLVTMSLLEELSSDNSDNPFGAISSNELQFQLYNEDDLFTPTNENSILFGKIETKTKVKVYIKEELSNIEWVDMGVFYVSDWVCDQYNQTVNVTCNDELIYLLNKPMPILLVTSNTSVYDFIRTLLLKSGLNESEFTIDTLLKNKIMKYAYPMNGTLGDTLVELSTSYMCYFYINRSGILCIKSVHSISDSVDVWSDDNQIMECKLTDSLLKKYSSVKVEYIEKSISDTKEIISLKEQTLNEGTTSLTNLLVNDGPIKDVNYILCDSDYDTYVSEYEYTSWDISCNINNDNKNTSKTNIGIYGTVISKDVLSYVEQQNELLVYRLGELPLEIKGEYIDNEVYASDICDLLFNFISNTSPTLELYIRGNPYIKPGDIVTISNITNKVYGEYMILSQTFDYVDGLESKVMLLKKDILTGGELYWNK